MNSRHPSYSLIGENCRYGMAIQHNYLTKFKDRITIGRNKVNINTGIYYTPINKDGSKQVVHYYDADNKLRFGALYMIDFSNLIYPDNGVRYRVLDVLKALISKHDKVASGSLISGSNIDGDMINSLLEMGFCVYNEIGPGREINVDAQIMNHISDIVCDYNRRERHHIPGLTYYYPHFNSIVIVTSDYNNENKVSFPEYMIELCVCGISVNHYDTMRFAEGKSPKKKALFNGIPNYRNYNICDILDEIKLKKQHILLPTFYDLTFVSHELIIKNGYYYTKPIDGFRHQYTLELEYFELNEYLFNLHQIWYAYVDVYASVSYLMNQ